MGQVDVNAELIAVLAPTEFSIEVDMSQVLGRQLLGDKFWARVYPLLHIGDLKSPGFIVGCTCQYLHISAHFLSTLDQAPSWLIWVGSVAGWGVIFGSILNMQMQQWRMGFASLECWFVRIQFIVLSCVLIDAAGFDERSIVYITMVAVDLFAGSRMDAMPLDFKTSWAFTAVWGVTLLCFVGEAVMLQLGNVPSEHGPPKQGRLFELGGVSLFATEVLLNRYFIYCTFVLKSFLVGVFFPNQMMYINGKTTLRFKEAHQPSRGSAQIHADMAHAV